MLPLSLFFHPTPMSPKSTMLLLMPKSTDASSSSSDAMDGGVVIVMTLDRKIERRNRRRSK